MAVDLRKVLYYQGEGKYLRTRAVGGVVTVGGDCAYCERPKPTVPTIEGKHACFTCVVEP